MPLWGWVLIAIGVVALLGFMLWTTLQARRSSKLRSRFGPEYNRALKSAESKREAESELRARERRREKLEIRPLPPADRDRYADEWRSVQAQFVDDPAGATAAADTLILAVMRDCGYPMEDFDQRAADVSVDHPEVVENYRKGHRLAQSADGEDATEQLRKAMRHYRLLFDELLEEGLDEPLAADRSTVAEREDSPARKVR
jgi:hypothetical protein